MAILNVEDVEIRQTYVDLIHKFQWS